MSKPEPIASMFGAPRPDWLARHDEAIIEPGRRIVDPHHHLWRNDHSVYMVEDYAADLASGHDVQASIYVECGSMYRGSGPEALRPLGEIEFAAGVAADAAEAGGPAICAAIIGTADLFLGAEIRPVLEAAVEAGRGRLRGIRRITAWDADEDLMANLIRRRPGMLAEPAFREGFACLAPLGLSFDAFVFQRQLPELLDLARAFPETQIVVDHCGGPIGVASYAEDPAQSFAEWRDGIRALAGCQNVSIKLGGLGMRIAGIDFEKRATPPDSRTVAEAWRPHIETCIEAFGPARSMFESNFPADKGACSYVVLWNAFKRIAGQYSGDEKAALFAGVASRIYRL